MPRNIDFNFLSKKCVDVRRGIIDQTYFGGSSHLGGSLSIVEILSILYFGVMKIDPKKPEWSERDRLVLSKGHGSSTLYAVLAEKGFFPVEELKTFMHNGSRLQKHLDMHKLAGIDVSSGSLGQGLSIAIGMALADRIDRKERYVYCIVGDGEAQEGQIWEAAMAAAQFQLRRLIVFLDHNRLQVDGFTKDIIDVEPVEEKWKAFGWHVVMIDGHNLMQIISTIEECQQASSGPHMIIAETVKGKGISFIENQIEWHSHGLSEEQYRQAMSELDHQESEILAGDS